MRRRFDPLPTFFFNSKGTSLPDNEESVVAEEIADSPQEEVAVFAQHQKPRFVKRNNVRCVRH